MKIWAIPCYREGGVTVSGTFWLRARQARAECRRCRGCSGKHGAPVKFVTPREAKP